MTDTSLLKRRVYYRCYLRRAHALGFIAGNRRLRRGQSCNRHTIRGARYVVHAYAITEFNGARIAAVLPADADFEVRAGVAAQFDGDLDELPDASLVDGGEWIGLENL